MIRLAASYMFICLWYAYACAWGLMELCSLALILLAPCPSSLYLTVPLMSAFPPRHYYYYTLHPMLSFPFPFLFLLFPPYHRQLALTFFLISGSLLFFFFFYIDVLDDIFTLV